MGFPLLGLHQSIRPTAGPTGARCNRRRRPCAARSKGLEATDADERLWPCCLQPRRKRGLSAPNGSLLPLNP